MAHPHWLIELPTCASTNDWSLARLDALAHGACVWTERQTAGRGRGAARWSAPPGVLTASFVLELDRAWDAVRLGLAAGLAVCHAVEDCCPGIAVALKWPNDCLIDGRKVAGILCERSVTAARGAVVVGIGLNLDPQWDHDPQARHLALGPCPPTSLAESALGAPLPTMPLLLAALRRYLLEACGVLAAGAWPTLIAPLAARDWLRGRTLTIDHAGRRMLGTARGIDLDGRLVLEVDGKRQALASAHVIAVAD